MSSSRSALYDGVRGIKTFQNGLFLEYFLHDIYHAQRFLTVFQSMGTQGRHTLRRIA